jgi:hypothetical protein
MEGSGRGLAKVHIPAFPWKIRGKPRKISVRIAGVRNEN